MDDLEKLGDEVDRAERLVKNMWEDADEDMSGAALDAYEEVFYDLLENAEDTYRRALEHVMLDELARSYNAPTSIRPEGGGDWDSNPDYIWLHRACEEMEAIGATMGTPHYLWENKPADWKSGNGVADDPRMWSMLSPPTALNEPCGTTSSRMLIEECNAVERVVRRHLVAYRRYRDEEDQREAVKQRQRNLSTPPKRVKATPTKYVRVNGVKIPRSKIR
jgi:hypothetical protein